MGNNWAARKNIVLMSLCMCICMQNYLSKCMFDFLGQGGDYFLEAGLRKLVKGTFFIYLMEETVQTFLVMGWCSTFFVIE